MYGDEIHWENCVPRVPPFILTSKQLTLIDRLPVTFYQRSIAIMGLSRTVSKYSEILSEKAIFSYPVKRSRSLKILYHYMDS